jgi:hypothetical protein
MVGVKVIGESVWTGMEEVVVAIFVCVVTLTLDNRADSQRSRSSRIPDSWKS